MDNTRELILQNLKEKRVLDSCQFAKEIGTDHQQVVGAIKSLESLGEVLT